MGGFGNLLPVKVLAWHPCFFESLSSPMSIIIEKRAEYPSRSFRPAATAAWTEFFKIAQTDVDLAHWNIHADSGRVLLTGRRSRVDESDPYWETPTPIVIRVSGVVDQFNCGTVSEDEIHSNFSE